MSVGRLCGLTAVLFFPLFLFQGRPGAPEFWWWLALNISVCSAAGAYNNGPFREHLKQDLSGDLARKVLLGLASAGFLYLVFYFGNLISRYLFSWAGAGINNVYAFKGGASAWRIGLLMALVIGPGEEILWRVLIQGGLEKKTGPFSGFILATGLYTAVHLASFNLMLVLAAGLCGLFWGWLYYRFRSPLLNIVSHTLWDLSVFLLFPFNAG